MRTWVRLAVLVAAATSSVASSQSNDPPPQYPPGYGQGAGGYGQPLQGGGEPTTPYGQPGVGGQPGAPGQDYCFTLKTAQTVTSLCGPDFASCERQRQASVGDGLATTDCMPWAPVACFQLGGDPAPTARWCAANLEDCEVWRRVDQQKNGTTGDPCQWAK